MLHDGLSLTVSKADVIREFLIDGVGLWGWWASLTWVLINPHQLQQALARICHCGEFTASFSVLLFTVPNS